MSSKNASSSLRSIVIPVICSMAFMYSPPMLAADVISFSKSMTTTSSEIAEKIIPIDAASIIMLLIAGLFFFTTPDTRTAIIAIPNILVTKIILNKTHP